MHATQLVSELRNANVRLLLWADDGLSVFVPRDQPVAQALLSELAAKREDVIQLLQEELVSRREAGYTRKDAYIIDLKEIERCVLEMDEVAACSVRACGGPSIVCYYAPRPECVSAYEALGSEKRVAFWGHTYNAIYGGDASRGLTFNTAGWKDSRTGEQIPEDHMREWLDDIVQTICGEPPRRVLEIGCGMGLIYDRLADRISKYTGIDPSARAVECMRQRKASAEKRLPETQVYLGAAHQLDYLVSEYDTVILNSVVQYFSGEKYLTDVIGKSLSLLKDRGRIIVGDVRDNRLLRSHKLQLRLAKVPQDAALPDFLLDLERAVLQEHELCIAPAYFLNLRAVHPRIRRVLLVKKSGNAANEMTRYRYNAVLDVTPPPPGADPQWQDWNRAGVARETTGRMERSDPLILLRNVPDPRLVRERCTARALGQRLATTAALSEYVRKHEYAARSEYGPIEALLEKASAQGYVIRRYLHEAPFLMNLVLHKARRAYS